jgi:C4-dicarboxylate transporter DctM subunit
LKSLFNILKSTAENAALIMFLMGTANFFGFIITAERLPQTLAEMIIAYTDNKVLVMFIVLAMLLVLGTFLDNVTALILFVPTMMGVVNALQIDIIFFGMFTVIALAVGQFTPPVGLNLFIASNISQVKFESVAVQIVPYLVSYAAMLVLFILCPWLLTVFA